MIESYHRGWIVVCDAAGNVLDSAGDPEAYTYVRSSAKPFQALPLVLSGAVGAFGLIDEEISIACASHNAEERHLAAVRSILARAGLDEGALQSGPHPPMYSPAAEELIRRREKPTRIHGNCSGKHAGMLAVCVHEGWDPAGYRRPDHPLQRRILELVTQVCGLEPDEVLLGGDGCGVPTFAMPLRGLATGFARIATGERLADDLAEAARRVRDAMREHPFMVAGTGRFDTEVMEAANLIAKSGAEGVFAAGSPDGWGMAIKASDGAARAVRPVASAALARRGVGVPAADSVVRDLHGAEVGGIEGLF